MPASYNDIAADAAVRDHVGPVWYQRSVWVPRGWSGRRIVLHFESATHRARVWVDDVEVVSHVGGYTPFEVDVTDQLTPGAEARITVEVDNTLTFQSIPPGVVEDTPHGPRQRYWHDFFNYSGLHRSVWLYATDPAHLTDVTVTTDLDGADGLITYVAEAEGGDDADVEVVLRDADGAEVARGAGATGTLTVPGVHKWAPGDGYLYDLELQLISDGELLDSYHQSVGVRTVRVDGARFLINGEPFYFTGFGKHEDIPVIGKGHNNAYLLHDFELLRWIGANSFRTSHYPYAEDVLDYADRQGIVLIDETAAVGLNMGLGGGIFGGQGYTTFSPETANDETQEVHAQAIRDLIARDKNHPSVVLWSIANEPESETEAAENYFRPLFEVAREADPTRPVGFVNVMLAPHGKCRVSQFADVLMLNRYYGWYVQTGDLDAAEAAWEEELTGWASDEQADHHHRVRRRHLPRSALGGGEQPVDRGVPGRVPGHEPPGVRPDRRRGRRAGVELRRLHHHVRHHAGRRQQEGRLHPRPAAEGRRPRPAPPVAQRPRLTRSGSTRSQVRLGLAAGGLRSVR